MSEVSNERLAELIQRYANDACVHSFDTAALLRELQSRRAKEAAIAADVKRVANQVVLELLGSRLSVNQGTFFVERDIYVKKVLPILTTLLAAERAKWEGVVKECRGVINDCHQGCLLTESDVGKCAELLVRIDSLLRGT